MDIPEQRRKAQAFRAMHDGRQIRSTQRLGRASARMVEEPI
jgi:hypothetical protein